MRGSQSLSIHDFKSVTDTEIALLIKKYDEELKGNLKFSEFSKMIEPLTNLEAAD